MSLCKNIIILFQRLTMTHDTFFFLVNNNNSNNNKYVSIDFTVL